MNTKALASSYSRVYRVLDFYSPPGIEKVQFLTSYKTGLDLAFLFGIKMTKKASTTESHVSNAIVLKYSKAIASIYSRVYRVSDFYSPLGIEKVQFSQVTKLVLIWLTF